MKQLTTIAAALLIAVQLHAQSAMDQWQHMTEIPGLASYFSGLFDHLGVRVEGSDETFTVHHLGDHFEMEEGISVNADFIVNIQMLNAEHLVEHGADSVIDDQESFVIIRLLFTSMTTASLNNEFLTKRANLKIGGVEDLIHVYLLDPSGKEDYTQTLAFVNDQWIVVPGLYGKAGRTFRMTPAQALVYQRKLFEAKKIGTTKGWNDFAKWYKDWREGVSTTD